MADMKLEAQKATKWVADVKNEIVLVNKVLDEVTKECQTMPGSNDVIFKMIEKTGNMLNDAWTTATNAYKNAWEKVEEGIDTIVQRGQQAGQRFEEFIAKHQ
jgi:phage-related protein